jgi:hypothetical protein
MATIPLSSLHLDTPMVGATAVLAGTGGLIPNPLAAQNNHVLYGDGTWSPPGRLRKATLTNFTVNSSIPQATVNDNDLIRLTQTTANITLTISSPTDTTTSRYLTIRNTQNVVFNLVAQGTTTAFRIPGLGSAVFYWDNVGSVQWYHVSTSSPIGTPPNVQTFTASGTYTPTLGMKYCIVELFGGGGAGGGCPQAPASAGSGHVGSGGSSGSYIRVLVPTSLIGASQVVTIGAGGLGNSTTSANSGGNTSLGGVLVANGGTGGITASTNPNYSNGFEISTILTAPGSIGSVSGSLLEARASVRGTPGRMNGNASFYGGYKGDGADGPGGYGATGGWFGSAINTIAGSAGASAANNTGAGGGGAFNYHNSASAQSGGNGGSGKLIITEYFY